MLDDNFPNILNYWYYFQWCIHNLRNLAKIKSINLLIARKLCCGNISNFNVSGKSNFNCNVSPSPLLAFRCYFLWVHISLIFQKHMFSCARDLAKCSQLTAVTWIHHKYRNKRQNKNTFLSFRASLDNDASKPSKTVRNNYALFYMCVKLQLKNMELLCCFWCCQYKEINALCKSRKYLQIHGEINFYSIYSGHLCLLWLNFYYAKALHET